MMPTAAKIAPAATPPMVPPTMAPKFVPEPWETGVDVAVAEELAEVWVCRVVCVCAPLVLLVEAFDVVELEEEVELGVKHWSML